EFGHRTAGAGPLIRNERPPEMADPLFNAPLLRQRPARPKTCMVYPYRVAVGFCDRNAFPNPFEQPIRLSPQHVDARPAGQGLRQRVRMIQSTGMVVQLIFELRSLIRITELPENPRSELERDHLAVYG